MLLKLKVLIEANLSKVATCNERLNIEGSMLVIISLHLSPMHIWLDPSQVEPTFVHKVDSRSHGKEEEPDIA